MPVHDYGRFRARANPPGASFPAPCRFAETRHWILNVTLHGTDK